MRGWKGGLSEFTDKLETVERYRRAGDMIDGEITLYDPDVFVELLSSYQREAATSPGGFRWHCLVQ